MADRFDLDAIEADDALLDLLAAGGESAWAAGEHDPALMLLAGLRLAVEVEDELPVETIDDPESFLARCAALNPVTDPFARKLAARGLALGVAAVAALSVSGVAAAVTGDPLAPYEKVIKTVVDGLRPETSFPKEQLDGLPIVDKSKIVKVGKQFQATQEEARSEQKAKGELADGLDQPAAAVDTPLQPPLALPVTQTKQQLLIETPAEPVKPAEPKPADPPAPVDPKPTDEPTAPVDPKPTDEPTAPVDPKPTDEPTTPTTPPPTTEPSTAPSTPPGDNGSTGNGSTGNGSTGNPGDEPSAPVTAPTVPATGSETDAGTDNGGEQSSPGDSGGDQTGDSKGDEPSGDQTGDQGGQTGDQGNQGADKPADPIDKPADPIAEVVASVLPVLPTPTGAPVEEPERLQQYFGKGFTGHGKHSSGMPALGWAKSQYAKGKHSTGNYAEGKHAAIARAHGSMAPVTIKQILGVLNTPMPEN